MCVTTSALSYHVADHGLELHRASTAWCEVLIESSISMSCADTIYMNAGVKE